MTGYNGHVVLEVWQYQLAVRAFESQDPRRRPNFMDASKVTGIHRKTLKRAWHYALPALRTGRPPLAAIKDVVGQERAMEPLDVHEPAATTSPELEVHMGEGPAGEAPTGELEASTHAPSVSTTPLPLPPTTPPFAAPPTPPNVSPATSLVPRATDDERAKLERLRVATIDALIEEEKLTKAARNALTGIMVIAGHAALALQPVVVKLKEDAEFLAEKNPERALKILKQLSGVMNQASVAAMRVQSMTRVLAGLPGTVTAVEHRSSAERVLSPEEISVRTAAVFEGLRRASAIDVGVVRTNEVGGNDERT